MNVRDTEYMNPDHRLALSQVWAFLQSSKNEISAGDGPIVDGTAYSPSDRAISYVEYVYQDADEREWEEFDYTLQELYESLDLCWSDGMLWRNDDVPEKD